MPAPSGECPRPDKVAYATEEAARGWHADDLARLGPRFNVYLCRCGAWHGGRVDLERSVHLVTVRTFGPALELSVAARLPDDVRRRLEP